MPLYPPTPITPQSGTHDCRFEYVDANTCKLLPYGGNQIMISGVRRTIPAGGVSFVTAGAGWSSLIFYIFAGWTGSAITINAAVVSSSTIIIDASGMPVLQADPSQTLIGMVACAGGTGQFQQTQNIIGVISYWNRKKLSAYGTGNGTSGSTSPVEINGGLRVYWCQFDGDTAVLCVAGTLLNTSIASTLAQLYVDNSTYVGGPMVYTSYIASARGPLGLHAEIGGFVAGLHSFMLLGWVGAGIGTWQPITSAMVDG
jgi:hypothetical protein